MSNICCCCRQNTLHADDELLKASQIEDLNLNSNWNTLKEIKFNKMGMDFLDEWFLSQGK